ERHSHSIDLYTDSTRFAPLGADATVAYGRKDLRFENTLTGLVSFGFRGLQQNLWAPDNVN
ncbi:MAG TPA: VanW family protein, partial [Anaeromyxobacteraceae bacterium]|nr:VanW family protein [Anaeromyxobacteraceae bacterium]